MPVQLMSSFLVGVQCSQLSLGWLAISCRLGNLDDGKVGSTYSGGWVQVAVNFCSEFGVPGKESPQD